MRKILRIIGSFSLVSIMLLAAFGCGGSSGSNAETGDWPARPSGANTSGFVITTVYQDVDWSAFGQYRANFHTHTHRSDGLAGSGDTIRDFYNKGYDILALVDHNVLCTGDWLATEWEGLGQFPGVDNRDGRPLTEEELAAINNGTAEFFDFPGNSGWQRTQSNGMISLPYTIEQSNIQHTTTLWAPFVMDPTMSHRDVLTRAEELGGISILNHPGRYNGGQQGGDAGERAVRRQRPLNNWANLFRDFDSIVGMEVFNRLDNETRSDRIFWDELLMVLMPEGRKVIRISNDDSHSLQQSGFNWNVMLMPELTADATRVSLETGAFYIVTRVARREGVNAYMPGTTTEMYEFGRSATNFMLTQPTPGINRIVSGHGQIFISGRDYDRIEWIADGVVIYTGRQLILDDHTDSINYYVRAQLISETGIAMTQPFGINAGDTNDWVGS